MLNAPILIIILGRRVKCSHVLLFQFGSALWQCGVGAGGVQFHTAIVPSADDGDARCRDSYSSVQVFHWTKHGLPVCFICEALLIGPGTDTLMKWTLLNSGR